MSAWIILIGIFFSRCTSGTVAVWVKKDEDSSLNYTCSIGFFHYFSLCIHLPWMRFSSLLFPFVFWTGNFLSPPLLLWKFIRGDCKRERERNGKAAVDEETQNKMTHMLEIATKYWRARLFRHEEDWHTVVTTHSTQLLLSDLISMDIFWGG